MPDSQDPGGAAAAAADESTSLLAGRGTRGGQHDEAVLVAVESEGKPMPRTQVALLCMARVVEPVAFFSVFPYISQMVQDNGGVADADVGFYSGLIESLFSLTQAVVMLAWGRAADRLGRKPVLVLSLVGMSAATALFGLARSLPQMILFRCLAGVFAGTIVTIRTMLAEHSSRATQARIFSWFAFSSNLGIFLGPLLGGALADPLRRHRADGLLPVDGGSSSRPPFLAVYPYALPGFVVAGIGLAAAVACTLFVEETLPGRADGSPPGDEPEDGQAATTSTTSTPSLRQLLSAPGVAIVLYVYGHVMLLAFAYTALQPVFWFTPVRLGGLGFSPLQISAMMGITGASQAAWLLLVFPPLQHRLGTNGVMRLCAAAYPPFLALSPAAAALLRYAPARHRDGATTLFWVVTPPMLALGSGVSMCFTAIQLALNDVAPEPRLLGTLNALALTGASAIRAFAPAAFTSLFAVGVHAQLLDGYAIWLLMVALGLGYVVAARHLPDYDALKKQREEEA